MQNVRQRIMSWKSETKQLNDIIAYANTCACKEVIFDIQHCLFSLNKANKYLHSFKSRYLFNTKRFSRGQKLAVCSGAPNMQMLTYNITTITGTCQ